MPDGFKIATAWVTVKADDAGLRAELRSAVRKASQGQDITIPVSARTNRLRSDITAAVRRASTGQRITLTAVLDSQRLRSSLTAAVRAAERGQRATVQVAARTTGLRAAVTAAVTAAGKNQKIGVPVAAITTGLAAAVTAAVRAAATGQDIGVPVRADRTGLRAAVTAAVAAASRGQAFKIPVTARTTGLRAALRAAINTATAGQRINLPLGVDAGMLRASIAAAVATAGGRHDIGVGVTVRDPMLLRQQVLAAVRWAAWGHKIEIPLTVRDPNDLRTQVRNAVTRAGRTHTIRVNTNLNVRGTVAQIGQIRTALAGLNATVRIGINNTSGALSSGGHSWQVYGAIAAAVLAAITVAAPMAAAAVTATLPIAFGAIGAAALRSDQQVRAAFTDMKTSVGSSIREAAAPFKPYLIDAMDRVTEGVARMKGPLSDAFRAAGPLVDDVADGVVNLGRRALPGITAAMERSGPAMQQFSEFLGQVGDGIGNMFSAITAGNEVQLSKVWANMGTGLRDALTEVGELLGTLTSNDDAVESVAVAFELLADSIELVADIADISAPAVLSLLRAFDGAVQQADFFIEVFRNLFDMIGGNEAEGKITTLASSTKALSDAASQAGSSTNLFGAAAEKTKAALEGQSKAADNLRNSIFALNDANRSAFDAETQFEQKIDDLTASFKENGATLDANTESGRKNRDAMSQAAAAHDEMIASGVAAGESLESMVSKSSGLRSEMLSLAKSTGMSDAAAKKYVNTLLGTPDSVKTMVKLERQDAVNGLKSVQSEIKKTPGAKSVKVSTLSAAAIAALEAVGLKTRRLPDGRTEVYTKNGQALGSIGSVNRALNNLDGKTATTWTYNNTVNSVTTVHKNSFYKKPLFKRDGGPVGYADGGEVHGYPDGGAVYGPGTGTSDSILAAVSNGEWVIRAAMVAKYGDRFMAAINEGRLPRSAAAAMGGVEGFAKGGKPKKLTQAQKDRAAAQKEARRGLVSEVTLTDMSILAGRSNAEVSSGLGKPASETALIGTLNALQTAVAKSGFSSATNKRLQGQITASARALFKQRDALDKVTKSLESARGKLDDLKGKFDSLKSSISGSLVEFGNVTKTGKWGTSAATIINQLQSDTTRTSQFAQQLEQLKAKGLNSAVLADIAQAGVTGGGMATAQSLLTATPAQLAEINKLQGLLTKSADAAGTTVANSMYGAGIKAAEGLVNGLESQQAAIEASMMKIAKSMEAAIKKALGIKSPSVVMARLGGQVSEGFGQGIQRNPRPLIAARRMAQAPIAATTGIAASGGTSFAPTFSFTFNGPVYAEREHLKRELMAAIPAAIPKIKEGLRLYDKERSR